MKTTGLTEAQINFAARKLCELRGIGPDEMVAHGADPDRNGMTFDVLLYSPAWKRAAREVAAADQMRQVLEAADATVEMTNVNQLSMHGAVTGKLVMGGAGEEKHAPAMRAKVASVYGDEVPDLTNSA